MTDICSEILGRVARLLTVILRALGLTTRLKPVMPPVPLHDQSYLEPGPEMVRTSKLYNGTKEDVRRYLHKDGRTLYETFRLGAKASQNGRCLGWRVAPGKPYVWQSYNETLLRAKNFGSGLVASGLAPGQQTYLGIYLQNCPEWIMAEQGAYCFSMVVVPLYDTLGADACVYIIKQTDMSVVVCEDERKVISLLDHSLMTLKLLITIKEVSLSTRQRAASLGVTIVTFLDVEALGALQSYQCIPPKPEDLCSICYTSGTTGVPKGGMVAHENIVACMAAAIDQYGEHGFSKNDVSISFLPLAHMWERFVEHALYMAGGSVGFYSGDIRMLEDDVRTLRPTIMTAVPRLVNKIYKKTQVDMSNSSIRKLVYNIALKMKTSELERGIVSSNSVWDKLAFQNVRESIGGRLRLLLVSSAPISGEVLNFARCTFGCQVIEAYGQTECCGPITSTVWGEHTPEHVGTPYSCFKIKLIDVPAMDYHAVKNQGEICVKGAGLFKGYYRDPERTAEVFDPDGWYHTGDIGQWLPNGTLRIIDRKKHIFKLSQGEHIAPEKIENVYMKSQFVEQIFVYGESLKSWIIAVVVPAEGAIKTWAHNNGVEGSISELCKNDRVRNAVREDMVLQGRHLGLKGFEQVKDIYLHAEPFTSALGLLTPTMKAKRPELTQYFNKQLADMYIHLD